MATQFNTLRMHLSRDFLLLDILIFVKILKEIILYVAFWNASAEGTCSMLKMCRSPNTGPSYQYVTNTPQQIRPWEGGLG